MYLTVRRDSLRGTEHYSAFLNKELAELSVRAEPQEFLALPPIEVDLYLTEDETLPL